MPWYMTSIPSAFTRRSSIPANPQDVQSTQDSVTMDPVTQEPTRRPINPQLASPLFTRIPAEIRNSIFKLVLTSFDDKRRPYKKGAYYYRPDHRYAQIIDTNLLLTCRRIYAETEGIPASINEHTSWYRRAPPDVHKNGLTWEDNPAALKRRRQVETIHLFTQQFWLESGFQKWTKTLSLTNATRLKMTIRHTDWWYWEMRAPLALEPKRMGRPSACTPRAEPSQPFEEKSWGNQFRNINGLKEFQLELETVESKKDELDAIVARARGWKFPLGNGQVLVLNQAKTTRTGWVGYPLGHNQDEQRFDDENNDDPSSDSRSAAEARRNYNAYLPQGRATTDGQSAEAAAGALGPRASAKPLTAKHRLVAAGVKFIDEHLEPKGVEEEGLMTYYIVTLTWFPRAVTDEHVQNTGLQGTEGEAMVE